MKPDNSREDGIALRTFGGYLYTVVTFANRVPPYSVEAELWWNRPADKDGGRWYYFRRYVDKTAEDALRRVEHDFKVWAEGKRDVKT
jgi:hypothetical protein